MSVLDFIDASVLTPAYGNKLPLVDCPEVKRICDEISYAIRAREPIFVYGDYDVDGMSAGMIWKEVLASLYDVDCINFQYCSRTHSLDRNIIEQVKKTDARVVIICDTGSSAEDQQTEALLRVMGYTVIILDHHNWVGNYNRDKQNILMFNGHEERILFGGDEISGAYTSLLVANYLCSEYFHHSLSYTAMVWALMSMYADVVDMSTPIGRVLYNVCIQMNMPMPTLFTHMNQWNYSLCRRLFSYQIVPRLNACFRSENFYPLNALFTCKYEHEYQQVVEQISDIYNEIREITDDFVPAFDRERIGDFLVCTVEPTDEQKALHIRNYSGLIANKIAQEEHCIVLVLIKDDTGYSGSYRDYYNRSLLNVFRIFCSADGHDAAFGVNVKDVELARRYLSQIDASKRDTDSISTQTISSNLIEGAEDVQVLALYNEYMNVQKMYNILHVCSKARVVRQTRYRKFYDVGLPYQISSNNPVIPGSSIILEPCISKAVELRCING